MMSSIHQQHHRHEDVTAWLYPTVTVSAPSTSSEEYYVPCATTEGVDPIFPPIDWAYLEPTETWNDAASTASSQLSYSPPLTYSHSLPGSTPPAQSPPSSELPRFYHCTFPSCTSPETERIFTRKSDWRRHTDKHTRPYRCTHASCVDLPGFSWPGGLNRHLEEQHTAAAQRHRCPYRDCKRHEKGFNRCWNLKNHVKKVHSKKRKEVVLEELKRIEREVNVREREEVEARRRREMAVGRLEELRGELQVEE